MQVPNAALSLIMHLTFKRLWCAFSTKNMTWKDRKVWTWREDGARAAKYWGLGPPSASSSSWKQKFVRPCWSCLSPADEALAAEYWFISSTRNPYFDSRGQQLTRAICLVSSVKHTKWTHHRSQCEKVCCLTDLTPPSTQQALGHFNLSVPQLRTRRIWRQYCWGGWGW